MNVNPKTSLFESEVFKHRIRLADYLAPGQSSTPMLVALSLLVEERSPELRCAFFIADADGERLRLGAAPNLTAAFLNALDGIHIKEDEGPLGKSAVLRELVVDTEFVGFASCSDRQEFPRDPGFMACWSVPVLGQRRELLGVLAVFGRVPRQPTRPEVELLSATAFFAGSIMQQFREPGLQSGIQPLRSAPECPESIIIHSKGSISFISQAGKDLLNIEGSHSAKLSLEQYIPDHLRNHLLDVRSGFVSTQLCAAGGKLIDVNLTAAPLDYGDRSGTVWVIRETCDREAAANPLSDDENRLREQFAFDLHDSIGQQLTGISLLLRAVGDATINSQPSTADDFKVLSNLVAKAISDVRILAGTMSSVTIERVGLAGGLRLLQQKAESVYRLRTRLSLQPSAGWTLDCSDATEIFRVVEEAISNVARHAQATLLTIDAHVAFLDLIITVADDGIGVTNAAYSATGLGLRSMRYRAERIGGTLTIEHNLPRGTSVQIRYPLK